MADKIVVEASPRDSRGKNEARRLRVTGNVPAVLYGAKGEALTLSLNAKQVGQILRSATGHNTLFQVAISGKEQPAIVKDWQVDPVSGNLLHVDLLRVAMDVRMRVKVPVHTFGEAAKHVKKIKILSVAELLARGIRSIHEETSISELFI